MANKCRFTQASIGKLRPNPKGKPKLYRDSEVRGLGLLVSGKTDRRTYVANFGKTIQRRVIGDASVMTLEEARKRAIEMVCTDEGRCRSERQRQTQGRHTKGHGHASTASRPTGPGPEEAATGRERGRLPQRLQQAPREPCRQATVRDHPGGCR